MLHISTCASGLDSLDKNECVYIWNRSIMLTYTYGHFIRYTFVSTWLNLLLESELP